jgi:hypothetical protein
MTLKRSSALAKLVVLPINAVIMGPAWLHISPWLFAVGMTLSVVLIASAIVVLATGNNGA